MKELVEEVYFDISGEWFTDLLRNVWDEGNELKAINIWKSSFPDISETDHIKTVFLDIVSGRKKLTGWASDKEGLKLEDEKESKDGIISTFEDIIRSKRDKLYIAELELAFMRANRMTSGSSREENDYNTIRTLVSFDESNSENHYLHIYNQYYTDLTEICKHIGENPAMITSVIQMVDYGKLETVEHKGVSGVTLNKADNMVMFVKFIKWFEEEQEYFRIKYNRTLFWEPAVRYGRLFNITKEDLESGRPFISKDSCITLNELKSVYKMYDIDITGVVYEEDREIHTIIPEKPSKEGNISGYISPDGNFYGCGFMGHIDLEPDLVECFKLKYIGDDSDSVWIRSNPSAILETNGWIKVGAMRFFWRSYSHMATAQQIRTMAKMMKVHERDTAHFCGRASTLEEAISENKETCEFHRRTINKVPKKR